jgi:acetyl-CoA C-acetyltransferase
MEKYGITAEQCAKASVKSRKNAKNNPYAQEPMDIDISDVLSSRMLASPIRLLDSKPLVSDGACAIILASEEIAKKVTDKPVWIKGMGNCYDSHYLGARALGDCDSLVLAAKRAYKMAGVSDPRRDIDVAEVSAEYSYQELLWSEGLGFCGRGEGGKLIDSGVTEMGGEFPINPSGGVLAGNPIQVAGAARVAEAALQLRGEAVEHQIAGSKTALAQGFYGPCGQSQCVIILGN